MRVKWHWWTKYLKCKYEKENWLLPKKHDNAEKNNCWIHFSQRKENLWTDTRSWKLNAGLGLHIDFNATIEQKLNYKYKNILIFYIEGVEGRIYLPLCLKTSSFPILLEKHSIWSLFAWRKLPWSAVSLKCQGLVIWDVYCMWLIRFAWVRE